MLQLALLVFEGCCIWGNVLINVLMGIMLIMGLVGILVVWFVGVIVYIVWLLLYVLLVLIIPICIITHVLPLVLIVITPNLATIPATNAPHHVKPAQPLLLASVAQQAT